jgi:site-specific DNA recombinase
MAQIALYARVSTRRQEQEATIESQIDRILTYAQEQGETISEALRFIDQAKSGDTLFRPHLDRLRDAAAAGRIERLYCLSPDRLG